MIANVQNLPQSLLHEASCSQGKAIIERYAFQVYDATILACTIENGIEAPLSKDMQNGQKIFDMMTTINPFQKA